MKSLERTLEQSVFVAARELEGAVVAVSAMRSHRSPGVVEGADAPLSGRLQKDGIRRNRRGGTVVLIGPGSPATDRAVAEFASREGVVVLGPRPYGEVPACMQALDVGVIPFRADDPFVQGINPNKVYQYLAAGLPVITTPVLDLQESPPDLLFATTNEEVTRALGLALDAPSAPERRRALARSHDWDVLAARMVNEIEARLRAA